MDFDFLEAKPNNNPPTPQPFDFTEQSQNKPENKSQAPTQLLDLSEGNKREEEGKMNNYLNFLNKTNAKNFQ